MDNEQNIGWRVVWEHNKSGDVFTGDHWEHRADAEHLAETLRRSGWCGNVRVVSSRQPVTQPVTAAVWWCPRCQTNYMRGPDHSAHICDGPAKPVGGDVMPDKDNRTPYERGYEDGESSVHADILCFIDEQLGLEVEDRYTEPLVRLKQERDSLAAECERLRGHITAWRGEWQHEADCRRVAESARDQLAAECNALSAERDLAFAALIEVRRRISSLHPLQIRIREALATNPEVAEEIERNLRIGRLVDENKPALDRLAGDG